MLRETRSGLELPHSANPELSDAQLQEEASASPEGHPQKAWKENSLRFFFPLPLVYTRGH